ncbi:MAG: helix-turn-helix transcriptional regulator [Clostridiales bacterium]|jgi:transcriptional regulator with XRE-family HTH domain|nr:helix-turn-helix transcriptional regulator [Clostridiales bacterium]
MKNVFAGRLKELRLESGLGQVVLSEKLGVSKGVISLWENGLREPSMSSIVAIARFFAVSADYLLGLAAD